MQNLLISAQHNHCQDLIFISRNPLSWGPGWIHCNNAFKVPPKYNGFPLSCA